MLLNVANISLDGPLIVANLSLIGSLLALFRGRCFDLKNRARPITQGRLYGD
jgi:hypothetical protein